MAELLTLDEIKFFYDKLIWKPERYADFLKKELSTIKINQILDYARRVRNEAFHQINHNYKENSKATEYVKKVLNFEFPVFQISSTLEQHKFSKDEDYNYKLNYWLETSEEVIKILEDSMKKGRKPPKDNPELKLSNILKDHIKPEFVKGLYQNTKNETQYLTQFLRYLKNLGYFKKVTYKKLETVGNNEFDIPNFKFNRTIKPPDYPSKDPGFSHIPQAKSLK